MGWVESMGVTTGCGCKEVYRFPHTTYPYSSCICSFCSSIPTFFILLNVFRSFKKMKKVGMLLQKRTDTRGVGISSMRKSIYILTTTPSSHTHRFHPLPLATPASCSPHPLATPIDSTHSPQLSSILLTCAKLKVWMTIVESGWNIWVWLVGLVVRRRRRMPN